MLDVSIRLSIMNLLLDLQQSQGLSLVFVTHDLAGASYMSDRIAIMYAGHLLEVGQPRRSWANRATRTRSSCAVRRPTRQATSARTPASRLSATRPT